MICSLGSSYLEFVRWRFTLGSIPRPAPGYHASTDPIRSQLLGLDRIGTQAAIERRPREARQHRHRVIAICASLFVAGVLAVIRYAKLHGTGHRPWFTRCWLDGRSKWRLSRLPVSLLECLATDGQGRALQLSGRAETRSGHQASRSRPCEQFSYWHGFDHRWSVLEPFSASTSSDWQLGERSLLAPRPGSGTPN